MTDTTSSRLTVTLSGNRIEKPDLPGLFRSAARRGGQPAPDAFLPEGYLRVVEAIDLSVAGRAAGGGSRFEVAVQPGQVLVLELPDGSTLITSAERLAAELQRVAPELAGQGTLELDAVRPRGAVSRGVMESLGHLVSKIFVLERALVADAIIDEAIEQVRQVAGDVLADTVGDGANWGVSYLATRALMWAIEKRLPQQPGLYRWVDARKAASDMVAVPEHELARDVAQGPLLIFIHGTASYTSGSFADLRNAAVEARQDWNLLEERYGERIYGFEHRTFSESPIENALALVRALPAGARIDLVTHSRGGIVGDLLCLDCADVSGTEKLIARYRRFRTPENSGAPDLDAADERDRGHLRELAGLLREKNLVVGRYVRVAAPASGTLLAGANLDLFLSSLLTLFGVVTTLQGGPFYLALRRIVLEIVRNRTDPNRIPGLEAMLPGSAISGLLRSAKPIEGVQLGVIAGDIEGARGLQRLVEILADWAIYERNDNDLVVDTASMAAGLARPQNARRLFVQGPQVNHFSYFHNGDSRAAAVDWLTAPDVGGVPGFEPLGRGFAEPRGVEEDAGLRGAGVALPVAIVLPGVMGSHLQIGDDRVWFDPVDLASGGLQKITYTQENLTRVKAEKLFEMFYGDLCKHLSRTHRVVRFPYDWRRPVQDAAKDLATVLRGALADAAAVQMPVRIVAHSMGGLVTRATAAAEPELWKAFIGQDGARFIMLGTPNQGSHLMVEMLLGKGESLRKLAMLDVVHDLQQILDIVAGFRGALQLLPRPGFADGNQLGDSATPKMAADYYRAQDWKDVRKKVFDFWFGNGTVGVAEQPVLDEACSLWQLEDFKHPRIPGDHPDKVIYVCGKAPNTPCGIQEVGGRMKMLGTPEGDGTVSWQSGRIDGIGQAYLMEASHGDLADTAAHFESIAELLVQGQTSRMPPGWPSAVARGAVALPLVYDAGPAAVPTDEEAARSLLGGSVRGRAPRAPEQAVLEIACVAMDLRNAGYPILVGHYENDPISGAEAIIDRDVVANELTIRKHLGLYPGPVGTATVVLVDQNPVERLALHQRGALVAGLGEWGKLTASSLTEAVRAAALRYLLSKVEREGGVCVEVDDRAPAIEVGLCALLLGYNSTANIGVGDSVNAVVRGVLEANRQFAEAQRRRRRARIVRLQIVERYLDAAITASKELRRIAVRLNAESSRFGMRVQAADQLDEREGVRQRLEVMEQADYWPRLIVTDANAPREGEEPRAAAGAEAKASSRAAAPDKLKYVFLSKRARAETEHVQSQPGLIEKLVQLSQHRQNYDRDLARTLFQLMVPLDFKEAARQTDSLALLVDEKTANLPWELLCADAEPLVSKTALVRQLASATWRQRVRSTVDKVAFVVGNPSTEGFAKAFPSKDGAGDPPSLPGAEEEAFAVSRILRGAGYQLVESIGQDQRAVDIINRLFQRSYRILHIAAHGEFEARAADGKPRGGVLLSDGLMLTAAEIGQMEVVPDLVFLNCCHLGTIDGKPATRGVEYNKLASSVARALIEMGVRAVVAAGWAVDDRAGKHFAEVFYRSFVELGQPFGRAIHTARRDTYEAFATTNTWGAFQAYGDPGLLMDPGRERDGASGQGGEFAAPAELIDQLDQLRERLKRPAGRKAEMTLRSLRREIATLLARGPASWATRGDVQYAIGRVYADFGPEGFALACEHYLTAAERENDATLVPVRAIEQLANLEARRDGPPGDTTAVERAIDRLQALVSAAAGHPQQPGPRTTERCALIGSAYKRLAKGWADKAAEAPDEQRRQVRDALEKARQAYDLGIGKRKTPEFDAYCASNRLMLDALLGTPCDQALMQETLEVARARYQRTHEYWDAMTPADLRLGAAIADRSLDALPPAANLLETIADGYRQARAGVLEDAKSLDTVVKQIGVLAVLAHALDRKDLAANLRVIAASLLPASGDSPGAAAPEETPPAPRRPLPPSANEPPAAAPNRDEPSPPGESAARKKPAKRRPGGGTKQ